MSISETVYSSTAENSRFLTENAYFAYRDPDFLADELYLDDSVTSGTSENALALEKKYIKRLDRTQHVSEGLARVAYKSLAVAQYARQLDGSPFKHKDSTYKNIGLILDKLLLERDHLESSQDPDKHHRYKGIQGLIAEVAVFTLLSFDNKLNHPLTGRRKTSWPHFVLPSSVQEDKGAWLSKEERSVYTDKSGFDLKIFTNNESEPVIPIQVKTSYTNKQYIPGVAIVSLDEIAPRNARNQSALPPMLRDEAQGYRTRASRLQLSASSRALDSILHPNIQTEV